MDARVSPCYTSLFVRAFNLRIWKTNRLSAKILKSLNSNRKIDNDYPISHPRTNLFQKKTKETRVKYVSESNKSALSFQSRTFGTNSRSFVLRESRIGSERNLRSNLDAIDSRTRNIKRAAEKGKRAHRGLYNPANWSANYSRAHTYEDGDNSEPMRIAFENYASISPIRDSLFPAERSFPSFCAPPPSPPSLCTAPDITRIMNACVRTWVRARRERRASKRVGRHEGSKEEGKGGAFAYSVVVEFAWRDSKAGSESDRDRLASTSKPSRILSPTSFSLPLILPFRLCHLRMRLLPTATSPYISTPHAGDTSVISVSPRGFPVISRNCCSCRKR